MQTTLDHKPASAVFVNSDGHNWYTIRSGDGFDLLKPHALAYLAAPASSAASERFFSLMGRMDERSNGRLSPGHFHMLSFIRSNIDLLWSPFFFFCNC